MQMLIRGNDVCVCGERRGGEEAVNELLFDHMETLQNINWINRNRGKTPRQVLTKSMGRIP